MVATDFFARQDQARRNTVRLVFLFGLAVLALILSIDLLLAATMGYLSRDSRNAGIDWTLALDPGIVSLSVFGTLIVVGGGSLFKIAQLRGGGPIVAEQLGGRRIHPDTADPVEQKILNVVEEMSIASGTPTPPIFLLDREAGINAFAAGFTPNDAVIGITRGAVERLTRDELQGVVAHEFSHIFNGDMRLNIRLMGILHGILIIGILGYFILRTTAFSGYRSRRSRDGGGGAMAAILALGAGLMAVGFFGTFFGNLIKAAVSRQREYLADASAVQFTRQPSGLAGALKKIGGLAIGARIESPNAPEASHMFFGRATQGLAGLFSTHPPLAERIRRIEPSWNGAMLESVDDTFAGQAVAGISALAGSQAARPRPGPGDVDIAVTVADMDGAMGRIGQPSDAHLGYATRLLRDLPAALVTAAHEPYGARAVIYALLLNREEKPRQAQLAHLSEAADPGVFGETRKLVPLVAQLDVRARLPLVDISLPALRALTTAQLEAFRQNVDVLVRADDHVDLFEWSLRRILLQDLEARRTAARPSRVTHRTIASVQAPCELLLSILAYAGARSVEAAAAAFEQARQVLALPHARLWDPADMDLDALDAALEELDEAAPSIKRRVLQATTAAIVADREVTVVEAELLRAISASLGAPMPPVLSM